MLRLLQGLPKAAYEIDRLRLLDFYLLFPHQLTHVTLPQELRIYKKNFPKNPSKYERIEDPKRIFSRLEPYQKAGLKCLASYKIIETNEFINDRILLVDNSIPLTLFKTINESNGRFPELISFLTKHFGILDFSGPGGLKKRTDLFEYRYDPS